MNLEILFVSGLLLSTILFFIWDRIRMVIVAMMVVVALAVSGVITQQKPYPDSDSLWLLRSPDCLS